MTGNVWTEQVIGAAIEVHRELGPGLVEPLYEEALCHELHLRDVPFERQVRILLHYKRVCLAVPLRLDLMVARSVIVELKAKDQVLPVERAQLLSYLRLADMRIGLLINFHVERLVDGISRVVNRFAETSPEDPHPDLHA